MLLKTRLAIAVVLLLGAPSSGQQWDDAPPTADPPAGPVTGTWTQTWGGNRVASFLSVPYARPPLGELRFLPPEPAEPWPGTLDCSEYRGECSQGGGEGQEDCLFLDVHSPEGADDLPVMFYIHGGGLNIGSSVAHFDPVFLGDFGVVLVSANYRLGPWGFLSANGTGFTGNQGFRDQNLALRWTIDNIRSFGGNPDKITIFGESAGSWSVMHQVLSPKAAGMFQGAIGQSGTPIGHLHYTYRTAEEDLERGQRVVDALGCAEAEDVGRCLQEAPWELLSSVPFDARGVVDGSMSDDPYLPDAPEALLAAGDFNRVPLMLGANTGEAVLYIEDVLDDPGLLDLYQAEWDYFGPVLLLEREGGGDITDEDVELCDAAREFYFRPEGVIDLGGLDRFVAMYTDALFQYGVHVMAEYVSGFAPTYQYLLSYEGSNSWLNRTQTPTYGFDLGVAHTDDLQFVFADAGDYSGWTERDEEVRRSVCALWTNFARTGDPNGPGVGGVAAWEPVSPGGGGHRYLDIGASGLAMAADGDYVERMGFWNRRVGP